MSIVRSSTLATFLVDTRSHVEAALDRFLPKPPACPPLISEAMRYSLLGGGKRLRPVLVVAAADAVGRRNGAETLALALPAACAVEFIHTYSLIHDDLPAMDNDCLRRGRPTLHTVYGDGIAILAGDALQGEAFALMAREPQTDAPAVVARKIAAIGVVASAAAACGMVGGQAVDLQAAGQVPGHALTLDAEQLRAMHLQKTGALIRASAVAGAIMAGATPAQLRAIEQWGSEVGLAFQIVDDILDVEGDAAALGKTAGKDAASDKPTYTSLFGLERAKAMASDCAERAHQVLVAADLTDSWLDAIADWVIARRN
ncbi:MAG: polyprenyl synthetase family protein [Acidobacteria bacterium]|nr:polyprenyl synthetase family protein [Acidobacteriota bacterium]